MNIAFAPLNNNCYTFTARKQKPQQHCDKPIDTFEQNKKDAPEKVFSKKEIDKFASFYCSIEDEDSRKMLRYCLEDDEERYGDILDKLDEAEGKDRTVKEKKSFTRKFLDLMMLPEFFDIDARWEAAELAKLSFFDDENNKDVKDILLELAGDEYIEPINWENDATKIQEEDVEEIFKPKKLNILQRVTGLFSTKISAK